jgi:putative transcriptional regulator
MKCSQCGHTMRPGEIEKYHYRECGLSNVYLGGLKQYVCPSCGETEVVIPNVEDLQSVIATNVATQPERLKPEEIRFLRVHLGFSGTDFASAIDVAPETVSRWENGRAQMEPPTEKLLRMLVRAKAGPFRDYEELALYASKRTKARSDRRFVPEKGHWKIAA